MDENNTKSSFLKFAIGFLSIVVFTSAIYVVWINLLSPQAKAGREAKKNYAQYLAWEKKYKAAMAEDTFGGGTPQETLNLFIAALEKEDVDLAVKYFMRNDNGAIDVKWKEAMEKKKEEGKLKEIAQMLKSAKEDKSASVGDGHTVFAVRQLEKILLEVDLSFNDFSKIWKIENL